MKNTRQSTAPAFRFTDEQMDIAKNTDLLSHLGYTIKRIGSYYTTAEMDSLRIKDRRTWRRYSSKQHGDAITFLREFQGMSFPEAVDYLLAYHGRSRDSPNRNEPVFRSKPPPKEEPPVFALPPPHGDQRRVFAYLHKRGIAAQVIRTFIDAGLLYEDTEHHNCVFVGKDSGGKAVFAAKRGTCDLDGRSFKGGVPGSDKDIGFRLPCDPEIEEVAVFEAPIDLMSFCTLCPEIKSNAVALCCLYDGPLSTYLQENPHIKRIALLLDGDGPGITAAKEMRAAYREKGYEVDIQVPKYGKDWNQQLLYKLTGNLPETPKKQEKPKKEVQTPMANIGKMISDKAAADAQWQEQRKKSHEEAATLRDAGVADITTVTITEVTLFPQGYAAALTQPELLDEPSVILADIGGWTVDLMRLDNRVPNAATCRSLELGMIRCLDEIAEHIRRKLGLSMTAAQIESVLRSDVTSVDDRAKEIIHREADGYVHRLLSAITESGLDARAMPAIFLGGGAALLKRHVSATDGLCRPLILDDVCLNAKGYERLVGLLSRGVGGG